jgi:Rad3-related DNA helicase
LTSGQASHHQLTRSIDQLNPFLSFRPGQREAIQEIVDQALAGQKVIQLDAGVGAGKSLILAIVARHLVDRMGSSKALYTTPQVKLIDQIKNDKLLNIPTLVGKSNYPCALLEGFTAGTCPLPKKFRVEGCMICPYEHDRFQLNRSKLGATTLDKLLFDRTIQMPDILIIDESSGLEEKLINQSEISLPSYVYEDDLEEGLRKWIRALWEEQFDLERKQVDLAECISSGDRSKKTLGLADKVARKLRGVQQRIKKVEYLAAILAKGQEFVIDKDKKFKTLDGRRQFDSLCNQSQVVILSSGTPCPQMLDDDYVTVSMPNPIPESQRPVFYEPCGKMSAAYRDKTIDVMAPKIVKLHNESSRNTLVHCHSYKVAEDLGNAIADQGCRVIFMSPGKKEENAKAVRDWMAGDNAILASVGCEEGLDCKGPKFHLNILAVVPFSFRGDKWVLSREASDIKANLPYYQQHGIMSTAITIQQAVGRTTRGPDDFSRTFVLDSNFGWFVKQYRAAFKEDFLYSIIWRRSC